MYWMNPEQSNATPGWSPPKTYGTPNCVMPVAMMASAFSDHCWVFCAGIAMLEPTIKLVGDTFGFAAMRLERLMVYLLAINHSVSFALMVYWLLAAAVAMPENSKLAARTELMAMTFFISTS